MRLAVSRRRAYTNISDAIQGGREDGRLQALEGPGEHYRIRPGRQHRGALRKAPRRLAGTLRLARRDLRQVSTQGACRLYRRGHGHRLRCGRSGARPGLRRGGHRVIRLVARLPQEDPRLWRWRGDRLGRQSGLVRALGEAFRGATRQHRAVNLMRSRMREASTTTRVARARSMDRSTGRGWRRRPGR